MQPMSGYDYESRMIRMLLMCIEKRGGRFGKLL